MKLTKEQITEKREELCKVLVAPTTTKQQPDCFAPIARLVFRKGPSAPLRLPERRDSIARKVSKTSRRAFCAEPTGIRERGVGKSISSGRVPGREQANNKGKVNKPWSGKSY